MPGIRIKYVGPLEFKVFRDYSFERCHSDDASGPTGTPGEMSIEVPDNVANEALKHREVFLQHNQKVPQRVKDLRLARPEALRREGETAIDHWTLRKAVATMLPDDTKRKATMKAGELAGAQKQIDLGKSLVMKGNLEMAQVRRELGLSTAAYDVGADEDSIVAQSLASLAVAQEALNNKDTENQALRDQLVTLLAQMERDSRLTPKGAVEPPSVGEYGIDADLVEQTDAEDEPFTTDIFAPVAAQPEPGIVRKAGRPPAAAKK